MFRTAFAAGPRPAASDLPPHLQPMAISHAAPRTDKRAALLGAMAIYGCIPLALVAVERFVPHMPLKPITTRPVPPLIELLPPSFGGSPVPARPAVIGVVKPDVLPMPALNQVNDDVNVATPRDLPTGPQIVGPVGAAGAANTGDGQSGDGNIVSNPGNAGLAGPVDFTSTGLQVVKQVDPLYPAVARMARIQGSVVLRMLVDERGFPIKAEVIEGPALLRAEALRAAQQWEFVPARIGSQPVMATFLLTLKFRLV